MKGDFGGTDCNLHYLYLSAVENKPVNVNVNKENDTPARFVAGFRGQDYELHTGSVKHASPKPET